MDLSLVDDTFLTLAEPQIAEVIAYPSKRYKYSAPKSDTLVHLPRLIGAESLITRENEEWRRCESVSILASSPNTSICSLPLW
jgi:hypothetical protein